ncbi:phytoene desaturase family protein [Mangrovibrevibacter kandeliae]|uniref:phytoene desaturase family protein n=1 Tax=Mangrovibrevibacter kandeliae TaxID=2968473 RepID=UPI002118D7A7|nr:NAD(P)/FAD-dependent oxidoreductase [Aurantimonas sp. CSK15Z-1]MCQ8782087.1 NAD(P)/FAD-dependent oxidoreductase [Aurantimonas sp. CSK15Z-1]
MAREFDAVFIGAGHNALAAAVHLASRGWSVGVFERNEAPGGACRTEEVTLPGFRHDLYATNLGLFAGSGFFRDHGDALARHGLAFVPTDDCFASPAPDGSWFGVSRDIEKTVARATALSPADAARWRQMVADFAGDAPHLFALLGAPMGRRRLAALGWKAWRAKGTSGLLELGRLLTSSPREFLQRNFEAPLIQAALGAWGMHLDFAPDVAGGALFPYLEGMVDQTMGMVIGKGGADTIIKAMVARIEELGGSVVTGAEVSAIRRRSGRADGIVLADGSEVAARRAVIAGVTPGALVDRLLASSAGSGDDGFDRGARTFRHGPGTMMVHLALSGLPDWTAGAELQRFLYVHLAPDLDGMAQAYAEAMAGLLPRRPLLVVGQQTAVDPSRAPAGRHTLWVQVRVVPGTIRGDAAGRIEARDWAQAGAAYADRVIDIIEDYAPGTRAKILGRHVETPADLERRNPNLVGGDGIGGSHHLSQNFLFRPMPGWARYRTPVDGLYLIGASTWPGGGLGAGSGYLLAQDLAGR